VLVGEGFGLSVDLAATIALRATRRDG